MSTNRNLLKEAIADAKTVKETAIANAKAALEESFAPQLKSMISLKLQEMAEEEELDEAGFGPMTNVKGHGNIEDDSSLYEEQDEEMMDEDMDLDELLKELNEEKEEEDEEEEMEDEEEGKAIDLEDFTDEDLKKMIEDVIADMMKSGELEMDSEDVEMEDEMENGETEMEDEEVNLDELLREIEEEESMMYEEDEDLDEGILSKIGDIFGGGADARKAAEISKQVLTANKALVDKYAETKDPNALKELKRLAYNAFSKAKISDPLGHLEDFARELKGDPRSLMQKLAAGSSGTVSIAREGMEEELEEAYATIKTLRKDLNEVNLLNAKLLYTNKIFKSKNLTENQKIKVLSSFDKATNVKEVKLVFETLSEGLKTKTTKLTENLGSASKALNAPKKQPIVESNDMVARFQKLAGIIKD